MSICTRELPSKALRIGALVLAGGVAWMLQPAHAQGQSAMSGIGRAELVRSDIAAPGREVIQVRVDFAPGVAFGGHAHPGEEVAYVLEGTLEYVLDGRQPIRLNAGEALFIPSGTPHSARNLGEGKASELATYIVEKGKPLLVLSPSP
jgi:quercetin dioxygenase-like cupin family protein